nr:hypothetical protein BaRGS_009279 [Batillaria attramentaria]
MYIGSQLVVILNGYKVIKEALIKQADVFSDRPQVPLFSHVNLGEGLLSGSGPLWKATRTTSLNILRQFGMGKNLLAQKLQEEINEYLKVIASKKGQPFDILRLTQNSVSNNICSIIFGKRFEYDDPVFQEYLQALEVVLGTLSPTCVPLLFPSVRFIPGDPFHARKAISCIRTVMDKFIGPSIETHRRAYEEGSEDDFINAYIRQMKLHKSGLLATNEEKEFPRTITDLFAAGTETTTTSIRWTIVYFLHHPDVQEKCYQEVLKVVGTGRQPDIRDKPEMTYLQATIMEVLRIANVVPLSVLHATSGDVTFSGYHIPEGSYVVVNLDSVLHDREVWGDPDEFRPERFIGPDGKLIKRDEFIPFSTGRRVCLGEALAKMELLLYLANMIQRFRFLPPEDGRLPSLKSILGSASYPKPFDVRFVPRE